MKFRDGPDGWGLDTLFMGDRDVEGSCNFRRVNDF
jgi:hypothetical protein